MASLKTIIGRNITRLITSDWLRNVQRALSAAPRKLLRRPATVHFFYQQGDPYSALLAQYLPALQSRYRIQLTVHPVPPPDAAAAPDQERLMQWSQRDAARLAASLAPPPQSLPALSIPTSTDAPTLARNAALRTQWGHYLGATLYFEGEWYWGTDRLHYLEERLQHAGLLKDPQRGIPAPWLPARKLQFLPVVKPTGARPVIHFFCSLRSPYTYLAAAQLRRLAEHYGADLKLRFVLPMVMRGLPVPLSKRLYILRDTYREAMRLGMPFGTVVDPVGKPVEEGLAILHAAMQRGTGSAFLEAFLRAAFASGVDNGDAKNLRAFGQTAGLTHAEVTAALNDLSWQPVAEANRHEMLAQGLWGVPSFRVDGKPMLWGQDRLWMLEEDLIAQSERV